MIDDISFVYIDALNGQLSSDLTSLCSVSVPTEISVKPVVKANSIHLVETRLEVISKLRSHQQTYTQLNSTLQLDDIFQSDLKVFENLLKVGEQM